MTVYIVLQLARGPGQHEWQISMIAATRALAAQERRSMIDTGVDPDLIRIEPHYVHGAKA